MELLEFYLNDGGNICIKSKEASFEFVQQLSEKVYPMLKEANEFIVIKRDASFNVKAKIVFIIQTPDNDE